MSPTTTLPPHLARIRQTTKMRLAIAAGIAIITVAVVIVPYGLKWQETAEKIDAATRTIAEMHTKLTDSRAAYRTLKAAYTTQAVAEKDKMERILPSDVKATEVARVIEDITNRYAAEDPALILKAVKFSSPQKNANADYQTIPFKVSINTNRANLDRLLRFFEHSGSVTAAASDVVRFFVVKDVDININPQFDPRVARGDIDAELSIEAYALTPEAKRKAAAAAAATLSSAN